MPEPGPAAPARQPAGERAALPLLSRITDDALDEDYLLAARRRAAADGSAAGGTAGSVASGRGGRRLPWVLRAGVLAAFGLLVAMAAVQTSRHAAVDETSRATLIDRITQRRADLSELQERLAALRAGNAEQERRLGDLEQDLAALDRDLRRLQVRTGFVPVTGPGVRASVDNAPDADPVERIRDEDLALLVNGLWSAGAEAIAVNGQRLTAITAIRNSGAAVEVNGVGVAPPYTVVAVGDPRTLQADFYDTASGLAFEALRQSLGFRFDLHNEESVSLPGAPDRLLLSLHAAAAMERGSKAARPAESLAGNPSGSGSPRSPAATQPGSPGREEGVEP